MSYAPAASLGSDSRRWRVVVLTVAPPPVPHITRHEHAHPTGTAGRPTGHHLHLPVVGVNKDRGGAEGARALPVRTRRLGFTVLLSRIGNPAHRHATRSGSTCCGGRVKTEQTEG